MPTSRQPAAPGPGGLGPDPPILPTPGRPITEQRWNTLHPKLVELYLARLTYLARMNRPGAVEITDLGLIIYFDPNEPR